MNPTPHALLTSAEIFPHIRIVMGMVIGLGITRLLTGISAFIQHPGQKNIYPVHIAWVGTLMLMLIHFWWWEVALYDVEHWSFGVFFFLIFYTIVLFLMCAFLFPDAIREYANYEDFFFSRRRWFFGLLATTLLLDVIDTMIKGRDHLSHYGTEMFISTPIFFVLCVIAMITANRKFHLALVTTHMIYEFGWVLKLFETPI